MVQLSAIITKEEDMYIARCPETGTVSQGSTLEESIENLREATALYLEEFQIKFKIRPLLPTFEVSNVSTT